MKRSLISFSILLLSLIVSPASVYACSGGTPPANINELLSDSDIVVTGRFAELDSYQLNGIFRVENYLLGNGAEYLLLALNNNYTLYTRLVMGRSLSGDCGGNYSNPYSMDAQYIFFLKQRSDGAFDPIFIPLSSFAGRTRSYYEFSAENQLAEVLLVNYTDIREWTFDEIVSYILSQTGTSLVAPEPNHTYPFTRPLLLSLESSDGSQSYAMLPVDSSLPVRIDVAERLERMRDIHECSSAPCTVFSYTGADTVLLVSSEDDAPANSPLFNYFVVGERILASPMSDTFAVWQENRIAVHAVMYPRRGFWSFEFDEVAAIEVSANAKNYPAAWSNDGRYLAFSDSTGLYLWDVFTPDAQARKLLDSNAGSVPTVRYFSTLGRYLAVSEGTNHFTYDIVSGVRFPDGLVSPDDRSLLTFDTQNSAAQGVGLKRFVPFSEVISTDILGGLSEIEWLDNGNFLAKACGRGYYGMDEAYVDEDWCEISMVGNSYLRSVGSYHFARGEGIQLIFDYDEDKGNMAVVENNLRLFINQDEIDLSQWLGEGEEIEAIEWMPSLFFNPD